MSLFSHLRKAALLSALVLGMAMPGAASAPAFAVDMGVAVVIWAPYAPPSPRSERRPKKPKWNFIWVSGRWDWQGGKYVWVNGAWMAPPQGMHRWKPGKWEHQSNYWVWVEGEWL